MDADVQGKTRRAKSVLVTAPGAAQGHVEAPPGGEGALVARLAAPGGAGTQGAIMRRLQRTYGNAAVQRVIRGMHAQRDVEVIHRKVVTIGSEKVEVSDAKEAEETEEAKKIIESIKTTYGIELSSATTVDAIKDQYTNVPDAVKNSLKTRQWRMIELRSLAKALKNYAPILGSERANSTRKDAPQELTTVGKVEQAIDVNTSAGKLDTTTLGEYFKGKKAFGLFKSSEGATPDFPDEGDQLVGTFVHEMGHGLLAYAYDDFVKETDGFWTDQVTKSGKAGAEAPITSYGAKNAREDLCETAMMFFVKPDTLKSGTGAAKGKPGNAAPKRYAFMEKIGKSWLPPVKDAPQVAPPGASTSPATPVGAASH